MKKVFEIKYIKKYNEKVLSKLRFLYGEKSKKKEKDRFFLIKVTPLVFAFLVFLGIVFELDLLSAMVFGLFTSSLILVYNEFRIFDKAKKKKRKIRLELAEFCDGISILLDAGIPLYSSIRFVSERMDDDGSLGTELRAAMSKSYDVGMVPNMEKALFFLAERCEDSSVSTFVSLVLQNARKGEDEVAGLLRIHGVNLRNERRLIAKQMADEASTLMLIPSVMVLFAIMVLIAAPAVISLIKM